jgi:hypothetical protein
LRESAQFVESVPNGGRRAGMGYRLPDACEQCVVWSEVGDVFEREVDSPLDCARFAQFEQFAALTVEAGHAGIVRQGSVRALPGR